jgi:pimeloyl-ACP methyl ester carboxylesterase
MPRSMRAVVLLLIFGPAACAADLALEPCRLEPPARYASFAAECGRLTVPENRALPQGRQLQLFVARIAAVNRRKRPDPLFVIAGGPGQSTAEFYASVAPAFARVARDRDLVLVDQRGTGRSHRLDCAFDVDRLLETDPRALASAARRCRETLAATADLRAFTTGAAVEDLEAVRRALHVGRINLYGVSYGSRVAEHYARRHPEATRALILDGVVAPQTVLGPDFTQDAEAALSRILGRCNQDTECHERFADPEADYHALEARLAARPVALETADPQSGKRRTLEFSHLQLGLVLRLASYSTEQAALLPLALHLARAEGDFTALGSLYLLAVRALEGQIATGMQESVICSEDAPYIDAPAAPGAAAASGPRGADLGALRAICAEWPSGPVDADFHQPFTSAAPALLLSGSDDPVTPPAEADLAARAFPDHLHLILPGLGHGQLTAPCIDRLLATFLDAGTARGLDASCTRDIRPMPFFTSLAGPAP